MLWIACPLSIKIPVWARCWFDKLLTLTIEHFERALIVLTDYQWTTDFKLFLCLSEAKLSLLEDLTGDIAHQHHKNVLMLIVIKHF